MKVKRLWVFETNSSSMHSFTMSDKADYNTIIPDSNWVIELYFWEFWWWYDKLSSPVDFASYIATALFNRHHPDDNEKVLNDDWEYCWISNEILEFIKIIKDHTWADKIIFKWWDGYYRFWYIDHQSWDVAEDMLKNIKDSIFKWKELIIDNDNN